MPLILASSLRLTLYLLEMPISPSPGMTVCVLGALIVLLACTAVGLVMTLLTPGMVSICPFMSI